MCGAIRNWSKKNIDTPNEYNRDIFFFAFRNSLYNNSKEHLFYISLKVPGMKKKLFEVTVYCMQMCECKIHAWDVSVLCTLFLRFLWKILWFSSSFKVPALIYSVSAAVFFFIISINKEKERETIIITRARGKSEAEVDFWAEIKRRASKKAR